ncbi:MAG: S8 family serine peptidase [Cyanobacteriota bacterium]
MPKPDRLVRLDKAQSSGRRSGVMGGPAGGNRAPAQSGDAFDGLLVSWQPGRTAEERANDRAALGLSLRETIQTAAMRSSGAGVLEWVDLPPGLSAEQAMATLSRRPGVAYAEKNWRLERQATSNDPYVTNGSTWGLYGPSSNPANSFGSGAIEAWTADRTGSQSVYVGIIDEGYQHTHPDLVANAGTNPGEIAGNQVDDDGNGLIDDVYGWDFAGNNNTIYDGTADDHGTHVAGTIGASGGNGIGVAGVNWNVKLLGAKFLGSNGGSTANAIKAVDYFTDLRNRGVNIVATNNSWGGVGYSQALADSIQRANNAGLLFIAAAGNGGSDGIGDNNDSAANYPSNYSSNNVIAVAAITSTGARSSFSNYGATTVDLGAPGSDIWSTVPNNSYASYSGTSMATPHVTGAAALLASIYPTATAAQIKLALLEGSAATPSLASTTASGGRLFVPTAITRLGEILGAPTLPTVSVTTTDSTASEAGSDTGSFQLTRTGSTSDALTINVLWQGTATFGGDYTATPASVTFQTGASTADIVIQPVDDTDYEGPESIVLKIGNGTGYTAGNTTANLTINDNETPPPISEIWGTGANNTLSGSPGDNIIGGVSRDGSDNGRGTIDSLTGLAGADLFVLADSRRGTFYNDSNSRNQGTADYAVINDLKASENDKIQLRSDAQYLIRNNGGDTELFLGDGNKTFSNSDEYVALIKGVNLASGSGVFILGITQAWTNFV